MTLKLIGAALIIISSAAVGFSMAAAHRREENALQQLILAIEDMKSDLQFRLTPLPELCLLGADRCTGPTRQVLQALGARLQHQESMDASECMEESLAALRKPPEYLIRNLRLLGKSLGRFDLSGQLSGLDAVVQLCRRDLEGLYAHRDERMRSYRTLGLCAGAALVILFI